MDIWTNNTELNRLHKKYTRFIYKNKQPSFKDLLKQNSLQIVYNYTPSLFLTLN